MVTDFDVYGVDNIEAFKTSVEESTMFKIVGASMVIMSELSDVQEMILRGMDEEARKTINRVKYLVHRFNVARP